MSPYFSKRSINSHSLISRGRFPTNTTASFIILCERTTIQCGTLSESARPVQVQKKGIQKERKTSRTRYDSKRDNCLHRGPHPDLLCQTQLQTDLVNRPECKPSLMCPYDATAITLDETRKRASRRLFFKSKSFTQQCGMVLTAFSS